MRSSCPTAQESQTLPGMNFTEFVRPIKSGFAERKLSGRKVQIVEHGLKSGSVGRRTHDSDVYFPLRREMPLARRREILSIEGTWSFDSSLFRTARHPIGAALKGSGMVDQFERSRARPRLRGADRRRTRCRTSSSDSHPAAPWFRPDRTRLVAAALVPARQASRVKTPLYARPIIRPSYIPTIGIYMNETRESRSMMSLGAEATMYR
jgi:hypothetical protein